MEETICPTCGIEFQKKTERQIYCKRKCFKKAYRKRNKYSDRPSFNCTECKKKTKLTFFPITSSAKWALFKCECGYNPYYRKMIP